MKLNPEKQFLLLTTTIFLIFGAALIFILSNDTRSTLIEAKQDSLVKLIRGQAERHLPAETFASSDQNKTTAAFELFYSELADQEVVRIKTYDQSGKIIYSDEPALIGKRFSNESKLSIALYGQVVSVVEDTDDEENEYEKDFSSLLEIYIPILKDNRQVGVIEVYYNLDTFNSIIKRMKLFILTLITLIFLVLYASLFWIFRRSSLKLAQAETAESEAQNKISKLKDDFVFMAAHELKAPTTIIKACVDMIMTAKGSQSNTRKYVDKINEINNEQITLINDLLEVARSDSGQLNIALTQHDLVKIINQAIEKFKPLTKQSKITLTYKTNNNLPSVLTNQEKIEEVLNNFITNAIKYNKVGGDISISHDVTTNSVITHVSDTGIGIKPQDQTKIFDRFFRCSTSEKHINGTGLGLFITKELVERMGGHISFTSEFGKGSTFSIELPIYFPEN